MTVPLEQAPVHDHTTPPPPQQSALIGDVAEALLAGAALTLTAAAVTRIMRVYGYRVSATAVEIVLALVDHEGRRKTGTKILPRTRGSSAVAKQQRQTEALLRAAYLIAAARRISEALAAGDSPRDAVAREKRFWVMHEAARKARMQASVEVAQAADDYGVTLGWYTHQDDRTTPECAAADGCNFTVNHAPLIGWPGTLHGGTCRCWPGPPYATGRTVDQATRHFLGRGL